MLDVYVLWIWPRIMCAGERKCTGVLAKLLYKPGIKQFIWSTRVIVNKP